MASQWKMDRTKFKPSDPDWTERPTRTVDQMADFKPASPPAAVDKYGGWLGHHAPDKLGATGFFRVLKVGSRWWLVDPDGNLYWT